jgi:hypothetical protein
VSWWDRVAARLDLGPGVVVLGGAGWLCAAATKEPIPSGVRRQSTDFSDGMVAEELARTRAIAGFDSVAAVRSDQQGHWLLGLSQPGRP